MKRGVHIATERSIKSTNCFSYFISLVPHAIRGAGAHDPEHQRPGPRGLPHQPCLQLSAPRGNPAPGPGKAPGNYSGRAQRPEPAPPRVHAGHVGRKRRKKTILPKEKSSLIPCSLDPWNP